MQYYSISNAHWILGQLYLIIPLLSTRTNFEMHSKTAHWHRKQANCWSLVLLPGLAH